MIAHVCMHFYCCCGRVFDNLVSLPNMISLVCVQVFQFCDHWCHSWFKVAVVTKYMIFFKYISGRADGVTILYTTHHLPCSSIKPRSMCNYITESLHRGDNSERPTSPSKTDAFLLVHKNTIHISSVTANHLDNHVESIIGVDEIILQIKLTTHTHITLCTRMP